MDGRCPITCCLAFTFRCSPFTLIKLHKFHSKKKRKKKEKVNFSFWHHKKITLSIFTYHFTLTLHQCSYFHITVKLYSLFIIFFSLFISISLSSPSLQTQPTHGTTTTNLPPTTIHNHKLGSNNKG